MAVLQVDPSRVRTIPAKSSIQLEQQEGNLQVCAYARVSTDEEEQMTSYHSQIQHYTHKIRQQKGWDFVAVFADEGISGTSTKNRTEFKKMIRLCKEKKIDLILTKSISRFARNALDSISYARMLKALGVGIIFEKENIDTRELNNEMIFVVLSAFAQAESESMSANIAIGKRNAYKQGRYTFPNRMYGYRVVDGTPEIVEKEATAIRMIYSDFLSGMTLRQIRKKLTKLGLPTRTKSGRWSISVIRNILLNEKYKGQIILPKTFVSDVFSRTVKENEGQLPKYVIDNAHAPIVSERLFDTVQAELARRNQSTADVQGLTQTGARKYSGKYALTSKVFCGCCGSESRRITWNTTRGGKKVKVVVWKCSKRHLKAIYCKDSYIIPEKKLHKIILDAVNTQLQGIGSISDTLKNNYSAVLRDDSKVLALDSEIENHRIKMKLLVEASTDPEISSADKQSYFEEIRGIVDTIATLEKRKETVAAQSSQNLLAESQLSQLNNTLQQVEKLPTEYDDTLVRELISSITVNSNKTVDIKFLDGTLVNKVTPSR